MLAESYSESIARQSMEQLLSSPLDKQVGGSHYKDCKIQPVEYILANELGFCEGNVVKYITRWQKKGGKQDLEKVKHYVEILLGTLTD